MVADAITGNISREATIPFGNIFAEAMRGATRSLRRRDYFQALDRLEGSYKLRRDTIFGYP